MRTSSSDWAGDPSSRKSQSSGHVEADNCPLMSFSRRQSCVVTSSGMAEHCAMCSTAEELLQMKTILQHFGFTVNTTLYCYSEAARGIAQRAGLGKVKALLVKTLWLQEVVRERGLQIKSIASKGNKAGLGTTVLSVARLNSSCVRGSWCAIGRDQDSSSNFSTESQAVSWTGRLHAPLLVAVFSLMYSSPVKWKSWCC